MGLERLRGHLLETPGFMLLAQHATARHTGLARGTVALHPMPCFPIATDG
jgi:hypothetical protein